MGKLLSSLKRLALAFLEPLHLPLLSWMQRMGLVACAVSLPNGATVAIASAYGTPSTMSAITNATDAVATLGAGHNVALNDILVLTSGWPEISGRTARVSNVASNDVTLEDVDTSSTTTYPAGSGTGSVKEVSTWQNISQILEFSTQGGDQQFANYSFLNESVEHQIPTVKSAQSFSMTIGDDASLAHYAVLAEADRLRTAQAIRITLPSGSLIYANCFVTLNKTPTLTKNEVMGLRATFSLVSEVTRYAA